MIDLGAISVKITATTAQFNKAMAQAKTSIKSFGEENEKTINFLKSSAKFVAKWGTILATAATAGAAAIAKASLSNVQNLKTQADVAGLSVAEFQRLSFAAKQFGVDSEELSQGFKDINDRVADFLTTGAGPMADFFEKVAPQVGVTAEMFRGLSSKDALQLFVNTLERANLNQQEMTFQMEAIIGNGTKLLPLLRNNGKAMGELAKVAEDLGIGLSEVDTENAIQAQRKLQQIGEVINNLITAAVVKLAPLIEALTAEFLKMIKESGGIEVVAVKALKAVGEAVQNVIKVVNFFGDAWMRVKQVFYGFTTVVTGYLAFLEKRLKELFSFIEKGFSYAFDAAGWALDKLGLKAADTAKNMAERFRISAENTEGFFQTLADSQYNNFMKITDAISAPVSGFMKWIGDGLKFLNEESDKIIEKNKKAAEASEALRQKTQQTDSQKGFVPDDAYGDFGASFLGDMILDDVAAVQETVLAQREQINLGIEAQNYAHLNQLQNDLISYLGDSEELWKAHGGKVTDLENLKNQAVKDLAIGAFEDVLSFAAMNSKKALKLQQAYGVANTIVYTAESIMKAFRDLPYPIALGASVKLAALGAIKIRQIKAASPNGGGGFGGGGGGALSPVGSPQQAQPAAPVEPARIFNVDLTGSSNISTQQARNLLELMNEQTGDGLRLNVTG